MKPRELMNLGVPRGRAMQTAKVACINAKLTKPELRERLRAVIDDPDSFINDPVFGAFARELGAGPDCTLRDEPAPYRMWGEIGTDFDTKSVDQMRRACELPVAAAGALMPDAHLGYGLPIGGVLATRGVVIPYAVGVDIACRMKLTILDLPPDLLDTDKGRDRLSDAIERETSFGMGAKFDERRDHPVLDDDWSVSPVTKRFRDKAHAQLGSSGSGNHFVEFGTVTITEQDAVRAREAASATTSSRETRGGMLGDVPNESILDLEPGVYLALLSHSGSRGVGASVCDYYSRLAMDRADLPKEHRHLAWLGLESHEGQEYWRAMNLLGEYASANHACIHHHVAKRLGARVVAGVENHHNFAWRETHTIDGRDEELIVHRKGATPAGPGVLGVIPGSMADPGYVVVGLGGDGSLDSASHGAGRAMSRSQAKKTYRHTHARNLLRERGVTLLSAGVDELPMVYKNIDEVMARQTDLVAVAARFDPRLVKMAPDGEKAED